MQLETFNDVCSTSICSCYCCHLKYDQEKMKMQLISVLVSYGSISEKIKENLKKKNLNNNKKQQLPFVTLFLKNINLHLSLPRSTKYILN